MKYKSGFTIVELLIVIVVIGILATLSYVAYTTFQSRARSSVLVNSLSQAKTKLGVYRVEQGAYPTTSNFSVAGIPTNPNTTYNYISMDGSAYCLTATNTTGATITYGITNTTAPTEGGCNNTSWLGNITLTNLVANGDFSSGTAGWSTTSATITATDNTATATVTAVSGAAAIARSVTGGIVAGRTYYVSFVMNPFNAHTPAVFVGNYNTISPAIPAGTFSHVAKIVTAPTSTANITIRLNRDTSVGMSIGSVAQFRRILLIDLTTAFGAGNEPTKEQMDAILSQFPNSYFSGTVTN